MNTLLQSPASAETVLPIAGNQRRHFRVKYPVLDRPVIDVLNRTFEVLDISEKGMRIFLGEDQAIPTGQTLHGFLVIGQHGVHPVTGSISICRDYELFFNFKSHNPLEVALHSQLHFLHLKHKLSLKFSIRKVLCDLVQLLSDRIRLRYSKQCAQEFLPFIKGVLFTHSGEKIPVAGEIIRIEHGSVAIELTTPVPYKAIMREQMYLQSRYNYS